MPRIRPTRSKGHNIFISNNWNRLIVYLYINWIRLNSYSYYLYPVIFSEEIGRAVIPTGQITEDDDEETKYPCGECDFVSINKGSLKQHKEAKHIGIRYPCDQCKYSATQQSSLKRHKQSKHEGIRYPCNMCEYAATTAGHLRSHKINKHDG